MFDRILVPLDGSAESESVLSWLRSWELPSKVILFHCLPSRPAKAEAQGAPRLESPEQARDYLEAVARTVPGSPELLVRTDTPGDRIVTAALQAEAGLVVLGCSGDFGAPRTLGSVNEIVARTCPQPVLLVKTPARASRRRVRRILAPLDAGLHGDESMDVLRGVARDLRAEVVLLHVGSAADEGENTREASYSDVQLNLIRQVWRFLKDGIAARTIMTKGSILEETLTHELSLDVDIVAIPKLGGASAMSWASLAGQCERAVLLYEPKEASSLLLSSSTTRIAALTAPRS